MIDESINESVLCWFGDIDRIVKRMYMGECVGRHLKGSTTEETDLLYE